MSVNFRKRTEDTIGLIVSGSDGKFANLSVYDKFRNNV